MNLRKRSNSRSGYSNKKYKKKKSHSITSIVTIESDSTSSSKCSSDFMIAKSNLSSIPDDRTFVELLQKVSCESKYLIKNITPIVLCCQYQNPIRCAYRLLHKNFENVMFLMHDDLNKEETTAQIRRIASNLTDNIITLIRILKAVKTIQLKLSRTNKPLQIFELYITHMKHILNYVVHVLLNTKTIVCNSKTYEPSPFLFHRLECRYCKQYVTFDGCHCTKWIYVDTVPSQTIQNQLLCPAEDGPSTSSTKSSIIDWSDLKEHLYKISTWKPYLQKKPRLKELTFKIDDKKKCNTTTPSNNNLSKFSLGLSKRVLTKSLPTLNYSMVRNEKQRKIRRHSEKPCNFPSQL